MDPEARHERSREARARRGRRSRAFRGGLSFLLLLGVAAACGSRPPETSEPAAAREPPDRPNRGGEELVRALGCAGCHLGVPEPGAAVIGPPLGPSAGHDPAFVFAYVLDPAADGVPTTGARMPSFQLSTAEALALALYLTGGGETGDQRRPRADRRRTPAAERAYREAREEHPGIDGRLGAMVFMALNCGACHPHPDATPWRNGPDLAGEDERARPEWLAGWLRSPTAIRPFGAHPGTGGRMPDFGLSPSEADSIAAFLFASAPTSDATAAGPARADDAAGQEAGSDPSRPPALTAHGRATAGRLLRERLPCLGCHRLNGEGGRIGPDLSTVARRRPADYIRAVVSAPAETAPGTVMPRVPMTDDLRGRVTAYLLAPADGPGASAGEPTPPADGPGASGEEATAPADEATAAAPGGGYLSLVDHAPRPPTPGERGSAPAEASAGATYARRCATCHGDEGGGDGFNAPYLPVTPTAHGSAAHLSTRPSATLFDGVYAGGRILGLSHRMPPFGESLSRERIWDLVAHMRTLCRCRGPAWSRDNDEVPSRVGGAGAPAAGRDSGEGGRTNGRPR